ncbi:hypothetical protein [Pontibacter sp. G13]|uniref:hypothetical protein n=1 Tax=Pontibacter sp. G13 TaxID=3074898 RepID=UPI00288AB3DA|nr:hypothetical protein [Pontibacter sp. G13]WNJ16750.1 hypothetical protein RJD25_17930 [Pontibacter sp. G13]
MDITTHTPTSLVIERKPFVFRMVMISISAAALLLWFSSIKEYGPQAYYRFTHTGSIIISLIAAAVAIWVPEKMIADFDLKKSRFSFKRYKGVKLVEDVQAPFTEIKRCRLATQEKGGVSKYRVEFQIDGTWIPMTTTYFQDRYRIERVVKLIHQTTGTPISS